MRSTGYYSRVCRSLFNLIIKSNSIKYFKESVMNVPLLQTNSVSEDEIIKAIQKGKKMLESSFLG